ncbi:MAG: hypothetical protein FWE03_03875 [Firmicutes bacterium]|nr:hypothetical protein [Bacillota bacterium]
MNNARAISVSAEHVSSFVIDEFGNLWSFGYSNFSQLGTGVGPGIHNTPARVNYNDRMNNARIRYVSAGGEHALAIDEFGNVWAWGNGRYGQIGDGAYGRRDRPVQVSGDGKFNGVRAVSVSAGSQASFAIDEKGRLWSWGQNSAGQLGDGTTTNRNTPMQINTDGRMNNARIDVISADGPTIAIDEFGNLWAWGSNWYGQLGDGTTEGRSSPVQVIILN